MNTEQQIDLNRNPSGSEEANEQFSTPDERADARAKNHEIELLKLNQGWVGKFIGSSDPSLNVALLLLVLGGICLIISCLSLIWQDTPLSIIERIVSFEIAVATFIFGKKME